MRENFVGFSKVSKLVSIVLFLFRLFGLSFLMMLELQYLKALPQRGLRQGL